MKEYIVVEKQTDSGGYIEIVSKLVRCKDCIHWYGKYHFCEIIDDSRDWNADDYCSVAERKEE